MPYSFNKPFAEVIESSLQRWTAQSWIWDDIPSFGSLVVVKTQQEGIKRTLYGVVYQIHMGAPDGTRSPFIYKKSIEELKQEQPQIFEFLKTTFSVVSLGYLEEGRRYYQLPPCPPSIHAFVERGSSEVYKEFFADDRYMFMLFSAMEGLAPVEELVLAHLKHLAGHKLLNVDKIENLIAIFSLITGNDYRRIKMLLQRTEQLL